MAITRAYVEQVLVGYAGAVLTLAGMSTATDGSNSDLNEPIRAALADMGILAADPSDVSDSDLAGLAASSINRFLEAAKFRLVEYIPLRLTNSVDQKVGRVETKNSQTLGLVLKLLKDISPGDVGTGLGGIRTGHRPQNVAPQAAFRRRVYPS
jgi:hypothetical protein